MSDIIKNLQVLSKESGCHIDISALLDLSVCPSINIQTKKRPYKLEQNSDYVTVTPTEGRKQQYSKPNYRRGNGELYAVPEQVCKKSSVVSDINILVLLGLLTQDDLDKYLHTTGELPENESYRTRDNCKVDPLLGLKVGNNGDLINLDVGGKKGLADLKVGKGGSVLGLNVLGKDGLLTVSLGKKKILGLRGYEEPGHGDNGHSDNGHGDNGNGNGDNGHGDNGHGDNGNGNGDNGHGDNGDGDNGDGDNGHGDNGDGDNGDGNNGNAGGDPPLAFVNVGGPKSKNGATLLDLNVLPDENAKGVAKVQAGGTKQKSKSNIIADLLTTRGNNGNPPVAFVNVGGPKSKNGATLLDLNVLPNEHSDGIAKVQAGGKKQPSKSPVQADVLTTRGNNGNPPIAFVNVGGPKSKNGATLLDLNVLPNEHSDGIAKVQAGGKKQKSKSPVQADVLTTRGNNGNPPVAFVNVGGPKSKNGATLLDLNVLPNEYSKGIAKVQAGGEKQKSDAPVIADLLTTPPKGNGNGYPGGNNGNNHDDDEDNHNNNNNDDGNAHSYPVRGEREITHQYQPLCSKGFNPTVLKKAIRDHADDVNHCIAKCQAKGALLTIAAKVKVGDLANINVCIAVEFNEKAQDGNCRYIAAPQSEGFDDSHLEDKKDCYTFVQH